MKSVSKKKVVEKFKTHFVFNGVLYENRIVCETMWKSIWRVGQATVDNMAHAHCTLDT